MNKLALLGVPAGLTALFMFFILFTEVRNRRNGLELQLLDWRTKYNLSDTQIMKIRVLETAFHGIDHWLIFEPRSDEEVLRHDEEISRVMNQDDGERFLRAVAIKKKRSSTVPEQQLQK